MGVEVKNVCAFKYFEMEKNAICSFHESLKTLCTKSFYFLLLRDSMKPLSCTNEFLVRSALNWKGKAHETHTHAHKKDIENKQNKHTHILTHRITNTTPSPPPLTHTANEWHANIYFPVFPISHLQQWPYQIKIHSNVILAPNKWLATRTIETHTHTHKYT